MTQAEALFGGGEARDSRDIGLAQLCFLAPPVTCLGARVRQGQIDALVRMVPLTISVNVLAALIMTGFLWHDVPRLELMMWIGGLCFFCLLRFIRIVRLRRDPAYAAAKPPTVRTILPPIAALSLIWVLPVLLWFDEAPQSGQLLMILVLFGMSSGASVTLSTIPPAALVYLGSVTFASLFSMSRLDPVMVPLLLPLFAMLLTFAVLWNARQFAGHLAATLELQEKAELINLLREFDASGSEWLWEVGPDLKVRYVSTGLADALGVKPSQLVGRDAVDVLDPHRQVAAVSSGMQVILDSMEQKRAFRDIAIPARGGRAWWSLSGKPMHDSKGRFWLAGRGKRCHLVAPEGRRQRHVCSSRSSNRPRQPAFDQGTSGRVAADAAVGAGRLRTHAGGSRSLQAGQRYAWAWRR